MEKTQWYKNPEMLVALSALFVGLLTAIISIYSAYVDREYARASVWPKLEMYRSFSGDTFSYGVSNKGTGPAIIEYAKIQIGPDIIKQWSDIEEFSRISQSHLHSTTMLPGQVITPIKYRGDRVPEILKLDENLSIELCYCSIYEECWTVNRSNDTQPVKECVIDEVEAFEQ